MSATAGKARAGSGLMQPEVLARLANLELIARAAVEGALIGLHRSPQFGFSQEFAEYRPYTEGDDPRFVDWNVYARTGRTYIKRFLGDTNSHLMILLDTSASMRFASGAVSKFRVAQMLAASLAYLASHQHDAIGLLLFAEAVQSLRRPSTRSGQLQALLHAIDRAGPGAGTKLEPALLRTRAELPRRGMVAVISDFYCDPQALVEAVRPLAFQGQDLLLLQVLDSAELRPQVGGATLYEDMESGAAIEVTPDFMREQYPERMRAHIQALRDAAGGLNADHVLIDTSVPLDQPLRQYLLFRQRRQ
ncbi:MAG: DUF58 domain-containing protein [Steroidobacteraceae bacterium]